MAKPSKAQQSEAARSVRAFESQIARHRLDHFKLDGGRTIRCVLTVTLPGGHELRFPGEVGVNEVIGGDDPPLREAHNVSKTGWTFGEKRITTADANALQMYAAKGNTWLSRYGNRGSPDLAAQRRIDRNRDRIVADIYFAAQILDTLSKHERTWIRDKYHPHGLVHDLGKALKGPAGFVLNPALALAYHTSKDKEFAGARAAASAVAPGAATMAAKAASTINAMRTAADALKQSAPSLGKVAPAALAASKTLHASAAIVAAREHSRRGNSDAARRLVQYAVSVAKDPATMHVAQDAANRAYAAVMARGA